MRAQGVVFAVHRIEADFLAPAQLDDRLEVRTEALALTAARVTLAQSVHRAQTCLFRARVTLVAMTPAGRPRRLPAALGHIPVRIDEKS